MTNKTDREICDAAIPGPWKLSEPLEIWNTHPIYRRLAIATYPSDADFITHFNPAKISEMLDRIEQLEAENERLKHELADTIVTKDSFLIGCYELQKERDAAKNKLDDMLALCDCYTDDAPWTLAMKDITKILTGEIGFRTLKKEQTL